MRFLSLIAGMLFVLSCTGQYTFDRWDTIKVDESGYLDNPWAGGFNNAQFSDIDMNGDGTKDLLVFDRSTDRCYTFINGGASGTVDYIHDKSYESQFPELKDWVLLVDYNCDGRKDIFTATDGGVKVYRNDYSGGLQFTLVKDIVKADGFDLYVSKWDIPAIEDVDNDGDLDILTFDIPGSFMEYYENLSMDNYGVCDSIEYTLSNSCWGEFIEDFGGCTVYMDSSCSGLYQPDDVSREGHAGSTTLAIDIDGDTDKDLIIGDLACTKAYMLLNGGTVGAPDITAVNTDYPAVNPIDLYRFPASFYVDVDNDGLKDLISAPNGISVSEDRYAAWFYKNTGSVAIPNFVFQQTDILQEGMIDVGTGAIPVFFDHNGDSLQDLLVANYGYFQVVGSPISQIALYENTGTAAAPEFTFITDDYESLSSSGLGEAIHPDFGDLDGDGDEDMMIGDAVGNLHYFMNTAGAGNVANFVLMQPLYEDNTGTTIDVGQYAAPQLVDVDRDDLLDLLIGERDGVLNYYRNTGSSTSPEFTLITNNFGGVNVIPDGEVTGYSTPLLTVLDSTGAYSLLVGAEDGQIHHYEDIDGNLGGTFTLVDSTFLDIFEGNGAIITGGDLNNDSLVDIAIGNLSGGVALYRSSGSPPIVLPPVGEFEVSVYPNPSTDFLTIQIGGVHPEDVTEVKIYDLQGRLVHVTGELEGVSEYVINVVNMRSGSYVAHVQLNEAAGDEYTERVRLMVVR